MTRAVALLTCAAAAAAAFAAVDASWIEQAGGRFVQGPGGTITEVDLRSSWVTDSDLARLTQFANLKKLDLSLTRITDRGLRALRPLETVTELNLYFAEQITDDGMSAIKGWKKLERLTLRGTKISDSTLEFLSGITALRSLDVGYAELTDAGLVHLGALTGLRELTVGGNKLAGPGLQFLRQLPQLTYLDLGGQQRTDSGLWFVTLSEAGLEAVATVTELRELRLTGSTIGAGGLAVLKPLGKLERLDLQGCKRVGDDAVGVLVSMKLKRVNVDGTAITAEGATKLRQAGIDVVD